MSDKYTDTSPMPFGQHKGKALANVPAKYLLWVYAQPWLKTGQLKDYIADNLDVLKAQAAQDKEDIFHDSNN